MPRAEKLTIRATGFAVLFGTAVILSGCVSTVDGRAVAASAHLPSGATSTGTVTATGTATSPAPATSNATSTGVPSGAVTPAATPSGGPEEAPGDDYTDLAIGDSIIVWDADFEADVIVRNASFESGEGGNRLIVTVDYECYDGECPFYVTDWTVTDGAGRLHRPDNSSGFGDSGELFGVIEEWSEKRGHLMFDVPPGDVVIQFDEMSGDPATWRLSEPAAG